LDEFWILTNRKTYYSCWWIEGKGFTRGA